MATKSIKPVTRETSAYIRDRGLRPIMATIHLGVLILRAKGLRSEEVLDIGGLYDHAVRTRVLRAKAERKGKRGRK